MLISTLVSGVAMLFVAMGIVLFWRRVSQTGWGWFWAGAGLWTVGVIVKAIPSFSLHSVVIENLRSHLPYPAFVASAGLFLGLESSLCEIGVTLAAVGMWRQLGRDAGRAIAVGFGAGAFEALVLGTVITAGVLFAMSGLEGAEEIRASLEETQTRSAALPSLIGPVERLLAALGHASSRALVLLGFPRRRWSMIVAGAALFTLVDAIAGAALVSGKMQQFSAWWIELAIAPVSLVGALVLRWCWITMRDITPGPRPFS